MAKMRAAAATLGVRIRAAREARGMSQVELAAALTRASGITWPQYRVSRLERQASCDSTTLAAVADALGVSADELLGRTRRNSRR